MPGVEFPEGGENALQENVSLIMLPFLQRRAGYFRPFFGEGKVNTGRAGALASIIRTCGLYRVYSCVSG